MIDSIYCTPANYSASCKFFLKNYIFIRVDRVGSVYKEVTSTVKYVKNKDKFEYLIRFPLSIHEGINARLTI